MLWFRGSLIHARFACVAMLCSFPLAASAEVKVSEVGTIKPPINVEQLVYDAPHQLLIARNSASTIAVIKVADGSSTLHMSNFQFTDLSLSPQGATLYAADYGGEQIGYGQPLKQHYVHRLELATGSWAVQKAVLAGNIEAVSDDTFVLKSNDQWVTFTYDAWGTGTAVMQLNSNHNAFPGYYASVYAGDFVYTAKSGRLIHGSTGISSQELQAFKIVDDEFAKQEGSGIYGSAQGHGGTLCLSTDGSTVYYGQLGVDALDVTHNLRTFPAQIYAATPDVAFAKDDYYDVRTGHQIDSLGFPATVYALDAAGTELWAYEAATTTLHHYRISVDGKPPVVADAGIAPGKDAGVSTQDASTPTPDAGAPSQDAGVPATSHDAAAPSLPDAGAASVDDAGASSEAGTLDASALDAATIAAADAAQDGSSANAEAAVGSSDAGVDQGEVRSKRDADGCSLGARSSSAAWALAVLAWRRRRRASPVS